MELALLALIALAIPFAGVAALVMALKQRRRIERLEAEVGLLAARLAAGPQAAPTPAEPPAVEIVPATPPMPAAAPTQVEEPAVTAAAADTPPSAVSDEPATAPPPPPAPPDRPGLEEALGTRWAVWIGGLALALGGLLLVRYSIEEGYLGPGFRVAAGALFGLALIGGGEWLRRREVASGLGFIPAAHIPGIVTAAGTASLFGVTFAAHALYGFIGPAPAFILLGLVGLGAMVASALHGPALAALGLIGALIAPILVSSDEPQPWPLVIYLLVAVAAAYGVARLRGWLWLALAGAAGALSWGFLLGAAGGNFAFAAAIFALAQMALAAGAIGYDPNRLVEDREARVDIPASLVMGAFAALFLWSLSRSFDGTTIVLLAGAAIAFNLALSLRVGPMAGAAISAATIAAGTLFLWPVRRLARAEPVTVLPFAGADPLPDALTLYIAFGIAASAALALLPLRRLAGGPELRTAPALLLAAAATGGPLAMLVVAYWRIADFVPSLPFAAGAGALGALFAVAAQRLGGTAGRPARLGLGMAAAAAIGAVALGLTFWLDRGMLTVALALAALGAAWLSARLDLAALRYPAGGLALVVLGRFFWYPTITGGDVGSLPILNWLSWGYGVPAAAFWLSAMLMGRARRDRMVQLCEAASLVSATLLVVFHIRHLLYGDPLSVQSGHVELGLLTTTGLAFSIALVRLDRSRHERLYRIASLAYGAWTMIVALFGLLLAENPAFTGDLIAGGAVFNSLIPGYLLPAVAAGLLMRVARDARPLWYVRLAGALALVLQLAYMLLAVRRLYQGPDVSLSLPTGGSEYWAYSAALIVTAIALLAYGLSRGSRTARMVSAAYMLAAILKVFLFDLSELDGIWRALSFIGLGLTLVGIGLAYQRLLRRPTATPEGTG